MDTSAVSTGKDWWRPCVCQRFDRLFALCFYRGLVKDYREGLSGLQCSGYLMCVKKVVLGCMCDLATG